MSSYTLSQLRELVKSRESELETLSRQRDEIDARMMEIEGASVPSPPSRNGKPSKNGAPRKTLHSLILSILEKKTKGASLGRIEQLVRRSGYQTKSKKFQNTIYQAIHKSEEIAYDKESKLYKVK